MNAKVVKKGNVFYTAKFFGSCNAHLKGLWPATKRDSESGKWKKRQHREGFQLAQRGQWKMDLWLAVAWGNKPVSQSPWTPSWTTVVIYVKPSIWIEIWGWPWDDDNGQIFEGLVTQRLHKSVQDSTTRMTFLLHHKMTLLLHHKNDPPAPSVSYL